MKKVQPTEQCMFILKCSNIDFAAAKRKYTVAQACVGDILWLNDAVLNPTITSF